MPCVNLPRVSRPAITQAACLGANGPPHWPVTRRRPRPQWDRRRPASVTSGPPRAAQGVHVMPGREAEMANGRGERMRSHLAPVLLALEMLCRRDHPRTRRARIAQLGLAAGRRLAATLLN